MTETTFNLDSPATSNNQYFILGRLYYGTGYEYDGNVFIAWVLQVRRAEVVAFRGYEYDGFLFS